jgi:dTDP-4-amino-4,6-dideoxygalactose transaminase
MTNFPFLPYSCPFLDNDDTEALQQVMASGYLSQGKYLIQFQEAFAEFCQSKFAVAFSHGSAALRGMILACGIGLGDEVITSALTFASTSNAILLSGAKPVFVDIDPTSLCLDPQLVEAAITQRTKAIFTIDFGGHPSHYEALNQIAEKHGLMLLSDAAHSVGATYQGKPIGSSLAAMTGFSFNPVKNMTTAEGGMVSTDDAALWNKLKMAAAHGMTREASELQNEPEGAWYYEQQFLSENYKLNEIQAALGISQLRKLPSMNEKRRQIAQYYNNALADLPLILTKAPQEGAHVYHLYPIQVREDAPINRAELFSALQFAKIGVQVHYIPVVLHPYYQQLGYTSDNLPHTMAYYRRTLSIPIHPNMKEADAERVAQQLRTLLS